MKTINRDQLIPFIRNLEKHGASMISATVMTDAHAKKTSNPYGAIKKLSHISAVLGYSYQNAANKAHGGVYDMKPRQWGHRLVYENGQISRVLVEHENQLYLSLLVNRSLTSPLYYAKDGELTKTVDKKAISHLLPHHSQTLPIVRDYRLDSIQVIKVRGEKWRVLDR